MKPMGDVVIERKHAPRASSHLSGAATQGCSPPSRGWASQPRLLLHLVATPGPRPYGSRISGASLSPVPEIPTRPQVNTHVFSTAQKPQAHFHATSTSSLMNPGMATHRDVPLQRIVDLDALARHRPVELALHLEQVPVHRRVLRERGRLQERVRQVLVRDLALPVIRGRRGALAERGAGGEVGGEGVLRGRLWGLHGASTSASASAARGTAILLRASEAVKGARAKAAACKRGSCVRLAKGEEALVAVRGQTGRRNTANTLVPSRVYDTWQPLRFDSQCGHYFDRGVCQPPLQVQDCSSKVLITLH